MRKVSNDCVYIINKEIDLELLLKYREIQLLNMELEKARGTDRRR